MDVRPVILTMNIGTRLACKDIRLQVTSSIPILIPFRSGHTVHHGRTWASRARGRGLLYSKCHHKPHGRHALCPAWRTTLVSSSHAFPISILGTTESSRLALTPPSTTEGLMAGAFLMKKLQDTRFAYPFAEADGPLQYAYRLMGQSELAEQHTYSIMETQGRMDSFNHFMVGKFLKFGTFPDRVKSMGYDLDSALAGDISTGTGIGSATMVDIGGGRGELLLEVQTAYPHLGAEDLIVQEFNADIDSVPGVRLMAWNYKKEAEQPVREACVYALQHILHNLPDLDAVALLQKISRAMAPGSRVLIIEYAKNLTYTSLHASMIALYGGRERSSVEWRQMAGLCGLEVTFEVYVRAGESLVEMRRADR